MNNSVISLNHLKYLKLSIYNKLKFNDLINSMKLISNSLIKSNENINKCYFVFDIKYV